MRTRLIYVAIIIIGVSASLGLARNLYNVYQNGKFLDSASQKLAKLRTENERLKSENTSTNDPSFIEREARNRLGLVKPGEVVVILPPAQSTPEASRAMAEIPARPVWQQWLGLLFGG
jgi:cell division protein FtsB